MEWPGILSRIHQVRILHCRCARLQFYYALPYQLHNKLLHDRFCIARASWLDIYQIPFKDNIGCVIENNDNRTSFTKDPDNKSTFVRNNEELFHWSILNLGQVQLPSKLESAKLYGMTLLNITDVLCTIVFRWGSGILNIWRKRF